MKVKITNNTSSKRWGIEHLPVRQTVVWAGPVFILIRTGKTTGTCEECRHYDECEEIANTSMGIHEHNRQHTITDCPDFQD